MYDTIFPSPDLENVTGPGARARSPIFLFNLRKVLAERIRNIIWEIYDTWFGLEGIGEGLGGDKEGLGDYKEGLRGDKKG